MAVDFGFDEADFPSDILNFKEEKFSWLSNMTFVDIVYDGIKYPSTENFYQAMKYKRGWIFDATATRKNIRVAISKLNPFEAKKFGKENEITSENFHENKLEIMLFAQRQKYQQEPFKTKLLSTGDCHIEEGNWWGDTFWGVDIKTRVGENQLGKIIMKVRGELRNGS